LLENWLELYSGITTIRALFASPESYATCFILYGAVDFVVKASNLITFLMQNRKPPDNLIGPDCVTKFVSDMIFGHRVSPGIAAFVGFLRVEKFRPNHSYRL